MKKKAKKITPGNIVSGLLGLLCAVVLGAVFYGAMVYQLTGEEASSEGEARNMAALVPLAPGKSSAELYPGPLLALPDAQLTAERAKDLRYGGQNCRVIERTYKLPSGVQAVAVSAYPAAYLERMALEGCEPQLITGFSLAGMDAVYALDGRGALLCARDGEAVYMIEAQADEQTLYALGAASYLE